MTMIAIARPTPPGLAVSPQARRFRWLVSLGLLAILALFVAHIAFGTVDVSLPRILAVLACRPETLVDHHIIWNLRAPRALVVVMAGAMLGLSGAILQSITRNPLAEPGLMGVTGGAVLAIVAAIVLGSKWEGLGIVRETGPHLSLIGVAGGMAAGSLTYGLSWSRGSDPVLLVLMGVLVAGTLGALSSLVLLTADENQVRLVLHWTIGSTNGRVWVHWQMLWPFALTGLLVGLASAGLANALQLGDGVAAGLGLSVERARFGLLFLAAWLTAGAVAVVGGIGFVGLIGPHLACRIVGSDARRLFPAAALVSGLLLLAADILARTFPLAWLASVTGLALPGRAGLPVGVITPMLGVPFFLWLVLRRR